MLQPNLRVRLSFYPKGTIPVSVPYRVGIDVGTFSLGCSAIEIDENDQPVRILSAVSLIHDSGLDPDQQKRAVTRLLSLIHI